jgi:hypothetical protein
MSAGLAPTGASTHAGPPAREAPAGGVREGLMGLRSCAFGAWRALAGWPPTG